MELDKMMLKFFWFTIIPRLVGRFAVGALLVWLSRDLNNVVNRNVSFYVGMVIVLWVIFSSYRTTKVYAQLKTNLTQL
jgi:hypothetical protein